MLLSSSSSSSCCWLAPHSLQPARTCGWVWLLGEAVVQQQPLGNTMLTPPVFPLSVCGSLTTAHPHALTHTRRYEDNFDAVNNVAILSLPSDKGSIDGYGSPDKFLEQVNFLFGKQTFTGGWRQWMNDGVLRGVVSVGGQRVGGRRGLGSGGKQDLVHERVRCKQPGRQPQHLLAGMRVVRAKNCALTCLPALIPPSPPAFCPHFHPHRPDPV